MIRTLECMFVALPYTVYKKKLSKEHGIYQNVCTKIKFDKNSSTDTTWKYNI